MELKADSAEQQERLGGMLARACPDACIIYLEGNLGAGKTTLVRGFLRALGYKGSVKSPTYTLLEPYELENRECYHFDLYRLADPEELEYLGIRDLLQANAVLLIEWPERGAGELPPADLWVHIHYQGRGRRLELTPETTVGRDIVLKIEGQLG
ncbi:MAG: tRNA (adenosine(37)-N6)-threonylcarbamoyltransferase complex ATPase subunit type 1 TsaE [Candidatus Sedimenticola sp. 20ELBAFRAG]